MADSFSNPSFEEYLQNPSLIRAQPSKNRFLLTPILEELQNQKNAELKALKEELRVKKRIQSDMAELARTSIQKSGLAGTEKIIVVTDKDPSAIYLKTSLATIQVDLRYDTSIEITDSLYKKMDRWPLLSLTGSINGVHYTLENLSIDSTIRIWCELLKHIERKKNPTAFGYKAIQYTLLSDKSIMMTWLKSDNTIKLLPFFEYLTTPKDRLNLYWYLSHYFGNPLDSSTFDDAPKNYLDT
jgi:hypothetical protein